MVTKAPSFQFYPADWLNDMKLQSCSLAAQGLLVNLMCLIHQSEKYGYLMINGSKPSTKTVIKLLRLHHATYDARLQELMVGGVLSKDEKGVIYCKRMVKDEQIREIRRKSGKLGGSPLLKQKVKQEVNQKSTPSSSSSSSSLEQRTQTPPFLKPDNKHFEHQVGEYFKGIKTNCEIILKLKSKNGRPYNPFEWVQEKVNKARHPGAINESLSGLIQNWEGIDNPYGWANTILATKNGNWIEKDNIIKSKEKWLIIKEKMAEMFKGFEAGERI